MSNQEATMRRVNAVLRINLVYDAPVDITHGAIEDQLTAIADHAAGDGWFSGRLGATEVDSWEATVDVVEADHPNRLPGTNELLSELAKSEDDTVSSFWDRLNYLSQDIWHGKEDPQYQAIAAKAGELAVEHAMDLSMTLRDIGEIVETLLPGMPEGDSKTQLLELLQHAAKIRA